MPEIAPVGSFFQQRYNRFSKGRLRTEIVTLEEALWLVLGLAFGWMAAKTTAIWIAVIPVALLIIWIFEQLYAKKYGLRTIHGRRVG
jgi:hypothetical protein